MPKWKMALYDFGLDNFAIRGTTNNTQVQNADM
jgi:hypothetical protein